MSIGERIISLRNERIISQGQIAKALNVSRQAVSKWENDLSSPDTLNLIRLADLLNTDVEYLATGKLLPPSPSPAPIVVNLVKHEDRIVEVEKIVEKPVVKRVIRVKYRRNPLEYIVLGIVCLVIGFLLGWIC
ncbi:MAG: helix-turn-helix transcriptional regulator [Oscillospiraceae bacterium]|nr:helix-turn-helix transcriptional regulator [Oscillospiraceae bacterium]